MHFTQDPIAFFQINLANSADMTDRKDSVEILASIVGAVEAEKIARKHGLSNPYYFSVLKK
ncbi:hypothetical protein [Escherichia phage Stevie_ev116]|uniref:Uncharacterized protein n=1 Tax=Escherichia phage Stevie_ev116 TaxID=2695840 RepID=A0A653FZ07_9CAUD|nr:hypothetical protein [Escherichia phage Stevie_ev116]